MPCDAGPPGDSVVEQVEALALEARRAYQDGRYEDAIQHYLRAFQLEAAGALLYNIAYVYDKKLAEKELAMAFYRRYISSPDADPSVVGRAMARLSALKKELGKTSDKPPVLLDTPTRPAPAPARPDTVDPDSGSRRSASGQLIGGWVSAGTGIAALATGVALGFVAQKTHGEFRESLSLEEKRDLRASGQSQALAADILMGVGAAAIVAGTVLILTAPKGRTRSGSADGGVHFGALATPNGAVMLLGGSW